VTVDTAQAIRDMENAQKQVKDISADVAGLKRTVPQAVGVLRNAIKVTMSLRVTGIRVDQPLPVFSVLFLCYFAMAEPWEPRNPGNPGTLSVQYPYPLLRVRKATEDDMHQTQLY
jgi:hypothetical protein